MILILKGWVDVDSYWPIIVIIIVAFLFSGMMNAVSSQNLQNKFASLGDMMGMPAEKIISVTGKPSTITNLGNLAAIYNWHSQKYQISLSFVDGKCTGIVQENIIN